MRFRSVTSFATALVTSLSISFAAVAATPSLAHADEDPATNVPLVPTPSPEGTQADAPATTRVYYGWQNLGFDAASIALFSLAINADRPAAGNLAYAGLGGYLFGSPLVHALHGHHARALGSLALRVGVPLGLGALTWAVEDKEDCSSSDSAFFCGLEDVLLPVFLGTLGAGVVVLADDIGLAYDEKPAAPSWTPTFQASKGGVTFGLAGTF